MAAERPNVDAAFDALVRAHYVRLYNFAYRFLRARDVAEDVVQDVFLKVWERRDDVALRDPLAYLYQAVRNECLLRLRRDRRWRQVDVEDPAHAPPVQPVTADIRDLEAAVARAVDALPGRCRLIFTMSREQDLSYAEIARLLGVSTKTVENQIARALKILRRRLAGFFGVAVIAFWG